MVLTSPHVRFHKRVAQVGFPQMVEIHGQESDLRGDVGAAKTGAELDAIKEVELAAHDADAARVEVAMTITNAARMNSPFEELSFGSHEVRDVAADIVTRGRGEGAAKELLALGEVLGPIRLQSWQAGVLVDSWTGCCAGMEVAQHRGEALHEAFVG